jgi:tetratricopeptide (TPR) repeat protein
MQERLSQGEPSPEEMEKWKEKLGLQEAEVRELDKKIREMVSTTKTAGALSWRIARAYMKAGVFDISSQYFQKAISENQQGMNDTVNSRPEIHTFESAIPFFEKALTYRDIEEEMLFEAGLSYANASRDRGWDKPRRTIAVEIFQGLMRRNPNDLRYPYELALIYFDSSANDGLIEGIDSQGYNDIPKAYKLLNYILKEQESKNLLADSISTRFTLANFLYRQGKVEQAEKYYLDIKSILEQFHKEGKLKDGLEKTPSYQNVIRNLQTIRSNRENSGESGF